MHWVSTSSARQPAAATTQHWWHAVFGNSRSVEVEIGCGTGTFIVGAARHFADVNYFGIEHSHRRAMRLQTKIEQLRLRNARVIAADAACIVSTVIAPGSVAGYHIYFPDPWWKRRHHRRRLFTPHFAAALAHTLVRNGRVYIATDVDDVFSAAIMSLTRAGLTRDSALTPPPRQPTVFEQKSLARGATIRQVSFVKQYDRPAVHVSNAAPITPAESPR